MQVWEMRVNTEWEKGISDNQRAALTDIFRWEKVNKVDVRRGTGWKPRTGSWRGREKKKNDMITEREHHGKGHSHQTGKHQDPIATTRRIGKSQREGQGKKGNSYPLKQSVLFADSRNYLSSGRVIKKNIA